MHCTQLNQGFQNLEREQDWNFEIMLKALKQQIQEMGIAQVNQRAQEYRRQPLAAPAPQEICKNCPKHHFWR